MTYLNRLREGKNDGISDCQFYKLMQELLFHLK